MQTRNVMNIFIIISLFSLKYNSNEKNEVRLLLVLQYFHQVTLMKLKSTVPTLLVFMMDEATNACYF